jgi:4-carboxymuconolactone decarboxylase
VAARSIHLARLSVLTALGREEELKREVVKARRARVPLVQIKEVFLQSYLFVGFPKMINAFFALAELPGSRGGSPSEPKRNFMKRGLKNCRAIYGEQTEAMLGRMREMHPHLAEWIVSEGYGKVLGRRWLSSRDRELAVIPILALQDVKMQLRSHLRGALRMGVKPGQIRAVFRSCRSLIPAGRIRSALRILDSIL